ncbi:GIY-YIG nuclease family protein [Colwellia sp. 12G3]|uniref:GIY-YIG nuclease family protein n=1 Tax=Colwellia sp. 12G3 TaxID=2058299 RepID=UPI000C3380EC|nr:GIY-YIG nuclease family protein [Colwellia sp. 12G3]PKI14821.1 hypothetical protein CXF71_13765 [Colwellia sp. 12G3]
MKNKKKKAETAIIKDISLGYVYVMTHSFFSDVVKIGCTTEEPQEHAKSLSAKTIGEYHIAFSLRCSKPCKVIKQIKEYLHAQEYVNEFYQVSPEVAGKLLRRETLKIPIVLTV